MHHFACFDCHQQLGGLRYVMKEDKPYCCQCFERRFAEFCETCGEQIGVDQGQMTHGGQHWHASECCFKCHTCSKPLLGLAFLPKNGVTFCSVDCSQGRSQCNSVDSANDSLTSNANSKEDLKSLSQAHSPMLKHDGNEKVVHNPWVHQSDTFKSQTDNSEGYGSLHNQMDSILSQSMHARLTIESESNDEDENTELLSRSQMIEARRNKRRVSYNLPPRRMTKSSTCSQLSGLGATNAQFGANEMNLSTRGIRRRASLPTDLNQHQFTADDDSCSTCSSSDDSDSDDAYEAEVIRSKGLRIAKGDKSPHSDIDLSTNHHHLHHHRHHHRHHHHMKSRKSRSLSNSCAVQ